MPHTKWPTIFSILRTEKGSSNKNEPYIDRSTFSRLRRYFEEKKNTCTCVRVRLRSLARAVTSDTAGNEKRSIRDPKTLSLVIVFARPVERYQNAPTAKCGDGTSVNFSERKCFDVLPMTRYRDSCIRNNSPVGLAPVEIASQLNATVSRCDGALKRP